jgi:hypothetical protein
MTPTNETRSARTHAFCIPCWSELALGIPPHTVDGPVETCCRCGVWTTSGNYLRGDPDEYTFCAH